MINYQQGFQENDVKWRLWMYVEIESTVTFFRNNFCENAELSHNIRIKSAEAVNSAAFSNQLS